MGNGRRRSRWRLGALAAVAVMACVGAALAAGPAESIAARRAAMHQAGEISARLRAASAAAAHDNLADAQQLADFANRIPGLFPAGSDVGDTQALKTIWTDPAGFAAATKNIQSATQQLVAAAQAGDNAGFADALKRTGAACGACHRSYREH